MLVNSSENQKLITFQKTENTIRKYTQRLIFNSPQMTWLTQKSVFSEYCKEAVDPHICFRQLSNNKQDKNED